MCSLYSASEAQGELGKGPLAVVAEQFTHFGTVPLDGQEVPNPAGQYLDSSISQLFAGYNLNNHRELQLNVPLVYRSYRRPDGDGRIEQGTVSGLGDLAMLGSYTLYRKLSEKFTFTGGILGGVKFPTGSTDRLQEQLHDVVNPIGPPSAIHGHEPDAWHRFLRRHCRRGALRPVGKRFPDRYRSICGAKGISSTICQ